MSPERRNGLADFKLDVQPAITEAANSTTEAQRHAETRKCKLNRKGRQGRKGIGGWFLRSFASSAPFAVNGLAECWVLIAECYPGTIRKMSYFTSTLRPGNSVSIRCLS